MRINHNIQALNAYRNLSQTMNLTSKSLEKLSSGLRINKAADDAAGLAISEKMRSQIRGLDMAERNTLDAISLIQTAEGALSEVHSILQRIRELSVQAANGTLEDRDREAIQSEIDQLTQEIDRIADTTQFNQKVLFSGAEEGRVFAEVKSDQVEYAGNGVWEGVVTAAPTEPAKLTLEFTQEFGSQSADEVNGKTFMINGLTYEIYIRAEDNKPENGNIIINLTEWEDSPVGDQIASNINHLMEKLKEAISKNDSETFLIGDGDIVEAENGDSVSSGKLTLVTKEPMSPHEAENITVASASGKVPDGVNLIDPFSGETIDTISEASIAFKAPGTAEYTNSIQISFSSVPKDGDWLKIDNLTIMFKDGESAAYQYYPSDAPDSPIPGEKLPEGLIVIDVKDKTVFDVLGEIRNALEELKNNDDDNVLEALSHHMVIGSTLVLSTNRTDTGAEFDADNSNGLEVAVFDGDFEANRDKALELTFQIGPNSDESLTVWLNAMDAGSLGIGRDQDGNPVPPGMNAERGVDVMSIEAAQRAIELIDNAITIVSSERSKLGAIQNRLEYTTNNLQTASENLTSAESRIRDLDMAEEMTNFVRNNILNQAGQAMLAQANQLPQGILQLLQ